MENDLVSETIEVLRLSEVLSDDQAEKAKRIFKDRERAHFKAYFGEAKERRSKRQENSLWKRLRVFGH